MTDMAINYRVFGVNVRSEPRFGDNIVGFLNQCHPVEAIGDQIGDRWMPCRAEIDGLTQNVFISKNALRDRVTDARESLARECVAQWLRFDKGKGKEHHSPYYRYVGEFWQSIGMNLDGKDRDVPWSAAFISYSVRTAGDHSGFKYAAAHSRYVNQAIRRKLDNDPGPYWGYRLNEHKPEIGDMVCRSRSGSGVTYDYAATHDAYKSHCDIVAGFTSTHVLTVGGNVSHSATKVAYAIDPSGHLVDNGKVYAVLKNMR